MVLDILRDTVLRILIAAAVVSLIVGLMQDPSQGWMEGTAILMAVVIIVIVTTTNEYMKQKQFVKLNQTTETTNVIAVRSGMDVEVSIEDIVVGDIIYLRSGDMLQVDGVLFRGSGLAIDESSITGESEIVRKDTTKALFLLSGSKVTEGNGQMLVCAVGNQSLLGKSRQMMQQEEQEPTPLQLKLELMAEDIGKIGMAAGLLTFIALLTYLLIDVFHRGSWNGASWTSLIESFIIMVTIVVVVVPEGLPLAVTLSLAYAVGKMKEENNFVRHLHACETMGGADNICSDKTGTLTENRMTAVKVFAHGRDFSRETLDDLSPTTRRALFENICCNSTAFLTTSPEGRELESGSRTECALLSLALLSGFDYKQIRTPEREVVQFPFSSASKKMTTVVQRGDTSAVLTKGACESVLPLCTSILCVDGRHAVLTPQDRQALQARATAYGSDSLRCIAFACKDTDMSIKSSQSQFETDLTFIGIVGIEDPVRAAVPEAVLIAQKAGVVVRMITGDGLETAVKVAKQCHLLPEMYEISQFDMHVMEGQQFRQKVGGLVADLDETGKVVSYKVGDLDAFREIAGRLRVLARSSPEDKFLLVTGLKEMGCVVAVTGDGTNDAPALRKSDVGLAMNISGTPLAKEAADIILIDDNFASIVTAIKWGRNIYDCIRKFLQFQLTASLVALFMTFLGAVIVKESPLTAVQMLWVNLIMDTLAALALATEKPTQEQLSRQPYRRDEYIITPDMWWNIISMAIYHIVCLLVILFCGPRIFGIESSWGNEQWTVANGKHFTIFFHVFVFLQLFNEINCRKLRSSELNVFSGFLTNWVFLFILAFTIFVQIALVQFGG